MNKVKNKVWLTGAEINGMNEEQLENAYYKCERSNSSEARITCHRIEVRLMRLRSTQKRADEFERQQKIIAAKKAEQGLGEFGEAG